MAFEFEEDSGSGMALVGMHVSKEEASQVLPGIYSTSISVHACLLNNLFSGVGRGEYV